MCELIALLELCLPLATPARPENKQTASLLSSKWPLYFKLHSGSPRRRWGKAGRRKNVVPTFPPPRVDITSKTWPSFADMLLRRWREGGTFGESGFFPFRRPVCHTSAGLDVAVGAFRRPPRACPPRRISRGVRVQLLGLRRCL